MRTRWILRYSSLRQTHLSAVTEMGARDETDKALVIFTMDFISSGHFQDCKIDPTTFNLWSIFINLG
jgi:hypothetical protein